jgi:hypothetical protein
MRKCSRLQDSILKPPNGPHRACILIESTPQIKVKTGKAKRIQWEGKEEQMPLHTQAASGQLPIHLGRAVGFIPPRNLILFDKTPICTRTA